MICGPCGETVRKQSFATQRAAWLCAICRGFMVLAFPPHHESSLKYLHLLNACDLVYNTRSFISLPAATSCAMLTQLALKCPSSVKSSSVCWWGGGEAEKRRVTGSSPGVAKTWNVFRYQGAGSPSVHCRGTFEQGNEPSNAHIGPCDELAANPGMHPAVADVLSPVTQEGKGECSLLGFVQWTQRDAPGTLQHQHRKAATSGALKIQRRFI